MVPGPGARAVPAGLLEVRPALMPFLGQLAAYLCSLPLIMNSLGS